MLALFPLLEPSAKPLKTSVVDVAVAEAEVDVVVVALTRVGLCAPQGCFSRQSEAHWLLLPHAVTHWVPQVTQT